MQLLPWSKQEEKRELGVRALIVQISNFTRQFRDDQTCARGIHKDTIRSRATSGFPSQILSAPAAPFRRLPNPCRVDVTLHRKVRARRHILACRTPSLGQQNRTLLHKIIMACVEFFRATSQIASRIDKEDVSPRSVHGQGTWGGPLCVIFVGSFNNAKTRRARPETLTISRSENSD